MRQLMQQQPTLFDKFFGGWGLSRRIMVSSMLITFCIGWCNSAYASCWPPLDAIEERQSYPVRVGHQTFTTGFYFWYVGSYRVQNLHCVETINEGPREWSATVGLGGDEPIGPRVSVDGKAPNGKMSSSLLSQTNRNPLAPQNSSPLVPLPALPRIDALSALPPVRSSGLDREALPPILPALPELEPLTDNR